MGAFNKLPLLAISMVLNLNAHAASTDIPLTLGNWNLLAQPPSASAPAWEETADGIKFYGSTYRLGAAIVSNATADLSDAQVYLKWMVHPGANPFLGVAPGAGGYSAYFNYQWVDVVAGNYTAGWSWNNSSVMPADTWLYTHLDTHPDMTWTTTTSTGNYDFLGGTVLSTQANSWQAYPDAWNSGIKAGHLIAAFNDNYGGTSAWVVLAEAKYDTASVPEPGSGWLILAGLVGLAAPQPARTRKSLS